MEAKRKSPAGGNGDQPPTLDRRNLLLRFRATILSTREAIGKATDQVLTVAQELGCCAEEITDVSIALREAVANAIIHGNENDPAKRVLLRCYLDPGQGMLLAVRDEGDGFDPEEIPDPTGAERIPLDHGRGIFLMRELMDHVEHRKGGREVVLFKKCVPASDSEAGDARRDGDSDF